MKLTVLGGGAAGGNTGQGCAGFLVQEQDTSVVLDLGPGTLLELRKHIDYRTLAAIVVSHYHADHILDLGALRLLLSYNPVPIERRVDVWAPPNSRERFRSWTAAFRLEGEDDFLGQTFNLREYDPIQALEIGRLRIAFAPTIHPEPAWAMRVSAECGRDLGYSADTGPTADLCGFFRGIALLICEASEAGSPSGDVPTRGHLTAQEAGELARASDARALILTHMWEENDIDRAASDASQVFGKPVLVARPGVSVTL